MSTEDLVTRTTKTLEMYIYDELLLSVKTVYEMTFGKGAF